MMDEWRARMVQEALLIVASFTRYPAVPSLSLDPFRVIEAIAMVPDVPIATDAARTHVPKLLTWRDGGQRDFCGELSYHRDIDTTTNHGHTNTRTTGDGGSEQRGCAKQNVRSVIGAYSAQVLMAADCMFTISTTSCPKKT